MLSAIDIPKSKSISIAFTALKSSILGLVYTTSFQQLYPTQSCSDSILQISLIFKLFFIIASLLDACLLVYFLCTSEFKRLEFYVLFGFHVIVFVLVGLTNIVEIFKDDCELKKEFLFGCFVLALSLMVLSFILMEFSLYFGLKFVHFGGQIVWPLIWISCFKCGNIMLGAISIFHGILSGVGLIMCVTLNLLKKNSTTAVCWKKLYMLSILFMFICYILSWLAEATLNNCTSGILMAKIYKIYGLIELISPVLLLIFLNTEMGDPRDLILKQKIESTGLMDRQNQILIDDTN